MTDPLIGSELGRFRIVRAIGEGGMGRVYEATQAESGALVAIKVLAERYARDVSLIERFFAEARAANLIAHDNIVKVHDLAVLADGRPYIVMERLVGTTLRTLIDDGPAPLGGILHVTLEVLSALAATHAAGIIHRDLKPDNIFITERGRAKVLDFGIAKLTGANAIARTQTGVVLGTPEYMAPEHISDGSADARTDLYAVGIVLFEALTGRRPFTGASDFELMRAQVSTPAPRVRSLRPDLPEPLDALIDRALAKRPADRFSSATSMANAIRHVAAQISIEEWKPIVPGGRLMSPRPPASTPPIETSAQRPATKATVVERPRRAAAPRRRGWLFVIAGALVAAGLAGAVIATQVTREDASVPRPVLAESPPALPVETALPVYEVTPAPVRVPTPVPPARREREPDGGSVAEPTKSSVSLETVRPVAAKDLYGVVAASTAFARELEPTAKVTGIVVAWNGGDWRLRTTYQLANTTCLMVVTDRTWLSLIRKASCMEESYSIARIPSCSPEQVAKLAGDKLESTGALVWNGSEWQVVSHGSMFMIKDSCP